MLNTITEMTTKPCMLTHQGFFYCIGNYIMGPQMSTEKH